MRFQINHKEVYGNRLFQNLQPQEIGLSIRNKNFMEVEEGGIIYNHADKSDYIYLLIKGQVRLKIYDSSRSITYITKTENDFFGEIELINNSQRQSTAMAVEKSQLYLIHTKELNELLRNKSLKANLLGLKLSSRDDKQDALDEMRLPVNINIENIINSKEVIYQPAQNEMSMGNSSHAFNENEKQEFNLTESEEPINRIDEEYLQNDNANKDYLEIDDEAVFDYSSEESISYSDDLQTNKFSEQQKDSIIDRIQKDIHEKIIEQDDVMPDVQVQIVNQTTNASIDSDDTNAENTEQTQDDLTLLEDSIEELNIPGPEQIEHISAQQYLKLKQKITESLYDEIKNPIRLIKNYAELLKQKSKSAEANKVLQKIIEQVNMVLNSIQTEKDFTEDELKIKPQVLYAASVLNDILLLLASYTEFRGIKLFRKYEADASVVIDKNLFYQACLQIVRFFCENFTNEGNIFVTLSRTKETVILKFKSTGSNITDDILNRLFEKSLVSNTTNLNIAKNIIAKHNGSITAQKSTDGEAEICISLPIIK